jgi:indolepyruvate ferredoxin oxidoreductase alpha subunit
MGNALSAEVASRLFLSGNDAVAHAVRDAGVRVAAAYPGTPSTEILEVVARFPASTPNGRPTRRSPSRSPSAPR